MPGFRLRATASTALSTARRSGPPSVDSGVGTQMTATSASPISASSVVARKPAATISATSPSDRSSTWETPELRAFTTPWLMSNPSTVMPALVDSSANGRPT